LGMFLLPFYSPKAHVNCHVSLVWVSVYG
jgi:hypothetical protein